MSQIRTTPTPHELRMMHDHPALAFGFFVKTAKPIDNIAVETPGIAIRDKSFPLQGGFYGINVIATGQNFARLLYNVETTDLSVQATYLLRDGSGQVPAYNPANRGPTGLPIRSHYI